MRRQTGSSEWGEKTAIRELTIQYSIGARNQRAVLRRFFRRHVGRRVRKQIYLYSGGAWNSTPTIDRKFIYDGWNLVLELNALSSDAVLEKYTWGLDLSGQAGQHWGSDDIAGIHNAGGIGGLLSIRDVGTTTSLMYFYNANGDVGQLVKNSDGSFGAKYQYYPYGGETQAVGSYASVNPFRFSSKHWDGEQQALYYGYRYHKPKLGRWLSRDPLQEDGGVNLYVHAANTPTNVADSLGLAPCHGGGCDKSGVVFIAQIPPPGIGSWVAGCKKQIIIKKRTEKECCDQLPPIDRGKDYGGVICCDGRKVACAWYDDKPIPDKCKAALAQCTIEHEKTHLDDINCGCNDGIGVPTRPPWADPSPGNTSYQECVGACTSARCLEAALKRGVPAGCEDVVRDHLDQKRDRAEKECKGYVPPEGC